MKNSTSLLMGLILFASCAQQGQKVNYVYSSETLDDVTKQCMQGIIEEGDKQATTFEAVTEFHKFFSDMEYEAYDGAMPEYAFRLDTASVKNDRNFKTIVVKSAKPAAFNVMYIHGGGWTFKISDLHFDFIERVSDKIDADVYAPLYPMTPRWNHADAFEMLLEIYRKLQEEGKPILLMGDSAGGNIVFGFAFYLKELGMELPARLIALSPAMDLTASNPDMDKHKDEDIYIDKGIVFVAGPVWAGSRELTDPVVSPVYGDPTGFPPTLISIGDAEVLSPDVFLYAEKSAAKGVPTTVYVGRGLWHVAPLSRIPFSDMVIDAIAEFVK